MWIGLVWGLEGAPPWAVSAPDLDVGAWAWVHTRVNRPLPPRGRPLVEAGAKASVGVVDPVG